MYFARVVTDQPGHSDPVKLHALQQGEVSGSAQAQFRIITKENNGENIDSFSVWLFLNISLMAPGN